MYASELRKFSHFYILKLLYISFNIFCWYFRYFVGTNDMLVGLHVPTNFQMYRQNSEKALLGGGGGGGLSGYANGWQCQGSRYDDFARGKFKDFSLFSSVFMLN